MCMKIRALLFTVFVVTFFAACTGTRNRFVIIGNITGIPDQNVVLEQLSANDVTTIIDSTHPDKNGHFEFTQMVAEPGLFRLHFKYSKFILLSLDRETVKVTADWNALEKYSLEGSPASENLKLLIENYRDQMRDFHTIGIVLDSLKARGNDSLLQLARNDAQNMNDRFTKYIENYADSCRYLPNAIFAARMLNPSSEIAFIDQFTQSLSRRFPNRKMAKDFSEYYFKISEKATKPTAKRAVVAVGDKVPDLNMFNVSRVQVPITSFRGKYVLVDFWASFCPPCRQENPNLVKLYDQYKDKNFTIYGISLDDDKDAWLKAIKDDKITWTQVSDLRRWESPVAKQFGVDAIPANFLVDPDGKIIARDLMGSNLEEKLRDLIQ